jgi:hypothetical protein
VQGPIEFKVTGVGKSERPKVSGFFGGHRISPRTIKYSASKGAIANKHALLKNLSGKCGSNFMYCRACGKCMAAWACRRRACGTKVGQLPAQKSSTGVNGGYGKRRQATIPISHRRLGLAKDAKANLLENLSGKCTSPHFSWCAKLSKCTAPWSCR